MNWNQNSSMVWDWGNLSPVCPDATESSKSGSLPNPTDAGVGDAGHGSVSSSDVTFTSSSELGHGSSKSYMSASTGSPFKEGNALEFNFHPVSGEAGRVEDSGTSMAVCHGEPLISLKLGKRTYFEKGFEGEDVKHCATTGTTSPSTVVKKTKVSQKSAQNSYCQVEGCSFDLSSAKDYHRKHKVCEAHSKAPKVVVAGLECRFCQQCSRLHGLAEFDQNKRSCRRRLSHHNARRRKPQTNAISFGSSGLSTMLYNDPRRQTNLFALTSWDKLEGFRFAETKFPLVKPTKMVGFDETDFSTSQISNTDVAHAHHNLDGFMSVKGTNINVFNQGVETSGITSNLKRVPVTGRALSLLSNESWASSPTVIQQSSSHVHPCATPPLVPTNTVTHELASTPGGFWQDPPPLDGTSQIQAFAQL